MKLEELRVLNGPNYWSVKRSKLILMRVDLEELEDFPTNKIPGFYDRIKHLIPSLYEHRCSEGKPGGFFQRVKEGTWMGHVIEHIALEIQTLAGMDTGFGRTRGTGTPGVYNIVFSYLEPRAGKYAGNAAIQIARALIHARPYNLQKDLDALKLIWEEDRLGPSTGSIVEEAVRRNIPYIRLDDNSLVQLGYGINQQRIEATIASTTSSIAVDLAGDKQATKRILEAAELPVPRGTTVYEEEGLRQAIAELGYPIVIKPVDGNQGKGVTTNINRWEEAILAFNAAKDYSSGVICERLVRGNDFRALVINNKFVAAAMRKPALVVGDGRHTIQELVDELNRDPRRGNGHENVMTRVRMDEGTLHFLPRKGYTPDTIPAFGEECLLKTTANLSTGGTARDVTELVHPKNISLFKRVARVIGLDICGIDIMAPNLSTSIEENGGAIIEVNAAPGFRMHLQPSEGTPRNVAAPVVDMLFPSGKRATIPIIAVTGTNGKTTTTRLIAHMCRQQGLTTGYTTTEGIYIQDEQIVQGDCSGPASAQLVLKDPTVEMAVLECARGGILRAGLGFQHCDIAVVTNVAEDHLGLGGIDTLEKMARVKAVVAESVLPGGYAVLNADDDLVYAMREQVPGQVALYSLDQNNPRILEHCRNNGIAAVYTGTCIYIFHGIHKIRIEKVNRIPITFDGKAAFNIANVLGAVLTGYLSKFSIEIIRKSLASFVPSPELTPGRMNIFNFSEFTVMIDYAHNPHGLRAVGKFIQAIKASSKIGIIAAVGDRRDEDIMAMGEEACKTFDELIVRMDDNPRGRTYEEIYNLLSTGIARINATKNVSLIPDEAEAVRKVLTEAKPGSFIVVLTDRITEAIEITKSFLKNEQQLKKVPSKLSPLHKVRFLRKVAI